MEQYCAALTALEEALREIDAVGAHIAAAYIVQAIEVVKERVALR